VDHPLGVFAGADEAKERIEQPRGLQGDLAVVLVDVEQAALGSGAGRRFGFVDRGGDTMKMQDTGGHETAEAGAEEDDRPSHCCAPGFADTQRLEAPRTAVAFGDAGRTPRFAGMACIRRPGTRRSFFATALKLHQRAWRNNICPGDNRPEGLNAGFGTLTLEGAGMDDADFRAALDQHWIASDAG